MSSTQLSNETASEASVVTPVPMRFEVSDPDGNDWLPQEINERLSGRV